MLISYLLGKFPEVEWLDLVVDQFHETLHAWEELTRCCWPTPDNLIGSVNFLGKSVWSLAGERNEMP